VIGQIRISPLRGPQPTDAEAIDSLAELALDLRRSCVPRRRPGAGAAGSCAVGSHAQPPRGVLQTASREQMQRLLVDSLFCQCADERVRSARQAAQTRAWFQHAHRRSALTCVPYFNMAVTHYIPRIIPHRVGVSVPLKAALVLSQW
jgi:hypothetical protein